MLFCLDTLTFFFNFIMNIKFTLSTFNYILCASERKKKSKNNKQNHLLMRKRLWENCFSLKCKIMKHSHSKCFLHMYGWCFPRILQSFLLTLNPIIVYLCMLIYNIKFLWEIKIGRWMCVCVLNIKFKAYEIKVK